MAWAASRRRLPPSPAFGNWSQSRQIEPGADVVAVLTGHQLKDPESGLRRRSEEDLKRQRLRVEPSLDKLRAALENVLMQSA